MIIVPVIDLKGGAVVRARGGDRSSYHPIETPLARGSRPTDVVGGILSVFPFSALYIADLDAIEGHGDNSAALRDLGVAFPRLRRWVDNGAASADAVDAIRRDRLGAPVIGSESQLDLSALT